MAGMSPSERRLQKELMSLIKEPPPGVAVDPNIAEQNLLHWIINMEGAAGTLYEGENFQLQFKFSNKYPFDSPEQCDNVECVLTVSRDTALSDVVKCIQKLAITGFIVLCKTNDHAANDMKKNVPPHDIVYCGHEINIRTNIPVHPHVYSNGHICLSILTDDWSPALSVQSVCLSIVSMLSSCKEKQRPPDNAFYVKTCNKNPKKTKWWYHDDSV